MTEPKVYKLVTVNTAPERARRLIGRVVEDVKERYTVKHVANVDSEYCSQAMHLDESLHLRRTRGCARRSGEGETRYLSELPTALGACACVLKTSHSSQRPCGRPRSPR